MGLRKKLESIIDRTYPLRNTKTDLLKEVVLSTSFEIENIIKVAGPKDYNSKTNSLIVGKMINVLRNKDASVYREKYIREKQLKPDEKRKNILLETFNKIFLKLLSSEIKEGSKDFAFISVGCGSGMDETKLDGILRKKHKSINIKWFGFDTTDYTASNSVFRVSGEFVKIKKTPSNFKSLFDIQNKYQIWIIANFTVHHMLISPRDFLFKCKGANKIILLDELASKNNYKNILYRVTRIGNDLISNYLKSPGWASEFLDDPNKFKVDYWIREESKKYFNIWNYPPPNSLVQILHWDRTFLRV